jgi:hypothetical protein
MHSWSCKCNLIKPHLHFQIHNCNLTENTFMVGFDLFHHRLIRQVGFDLFQQNIIVTNYRRRYLSDEIAFKILEEISMKILLNFLFLNFKDVVF